MSTDTEMQLRTALLDEIAEWKRLRDSARRHESGEPDADNGYAAGLQRAIYGVESILWGALAALPESNVRATTPPTRG